MKKFFLLAAFLLLGTGLFAQMSKADVTTFLSKCTLTSGSFMIFNTYGDNSQDGLYHTYTEFDLSEMTFTPMESGLMYQKGGTISILAYSAISHMDYFVSDGKSYLQITMLN